MTVTANQIENNEHFYNEVKTFQTAFGHPVAEQPTPMSLERATSRAIWTAEEVVVEFLHQTSDNEEQFLQAMATFQAGLEKAVVKSLGNEYTKTDVERLVGQGDALSDGQYFISGSFVETGLKPTPLFDIVQKANMAKLGEDGKPIKRESDGKIMKPEGWMPPEPQLEAEVLRQIKEAS
jgi:predicted HAD superfamily Cof-like phosphohydrolase